MQDVAKAILLERGNLVLQLRDNIPSIETPGMWSLFGGMIEKNEDPQEAMLREIEEELCIKVKDIFFCGIAFIVGKMERRCSIKFMRPISRSYGANIG